MTRQKVWKVSGIICIGVGITTRLRAGNFGIWNPVGARLFSFLQNVRPGSGTNSPSYLLGTGVFSGGGGELLGREFNHSIPRSAEVKMSGAIPPVTLCLQDVVRENFTCYLIYVLDSLVSISLGILPWPVSIFTHFLMLRARIAFHFALRYLTCPRTTQPSILWTP
jgi:hypothetical protein